ncbi:DUF1194 domain-containing protein [Chelativorans alearense]|uniref:DUF1194 domain-containing protein n=1 Tax=Chelativorans alearense TaxID=2681495 RepID=UPI0013D51987|nr:DUF1194 domain-containing protein [Chelativorans alearense]
MGEGVDTALVFVIDASSSMDQGQLQLARESHAEAIMSPEVLDAIRSGHFRRSAFAFVEFSSQSAAVVEWMIIDSPETAATFAWQILHNERANLGELTGIGEGLAKALELMNALPAEPLYRVIDVVGDGKPNTGVDPAPVRELIIAMGVTINGMPMLDSTYEDIEEYYAREVVGGARAFSIPLDKIQHMPTLLRRKLIIEIG